LVGVKACTIQDVHTREVTGNDVLGLQ